MSQSGEQQENIQEMDNGINEEEIPNNKLAEHQSIESQLESLDKDMEQNQNVQQFQDSEQDQSNEQQVQNHGNQSDAMEIDPEISGELDRLEAEADKRAEEIKEKSIEKINEHDQQDNQDDQDHQKNQDKQNQDLIETQEKESEEQTNSDAIKEVPSQPESSDSKPTESQPSQSSPKPLSIENEISELTEAATTTIETDGDTILRNGIPIPRDSALFQSIDISYNPLQNFDISPSLLIKANLASLPLTLQAHESLPFRIQFLIHSIPLLDNISTQILRMIGVGPYEETLAIITSEEPTPEGLVYKDLVELFEQVKRIYSDEDPFLSFYNLIEDVDSLDINIIKTLKELEDPIDSAIRKTNLATFLLATLGSIEVGFFYLNESFLDVFCPTHNNGWFKNNNQIPNTLSITAGKLLKAQAGLFLELKTQAYISALESGDRSKEEVLEDIFPDDLKNQLLQRRRTDDLSPAEQDFLQRCKSRRETLLTTPDDQDLSEHYEWLIFLKELFNYVSKNIGFLIWGRKGRHSVLTTIGASGFDSIASSSPTPSITNQYSSLSKEELQKRLEKQKAKERELKERDEKEAQELEQSKYLINNPQERSSNSIDTSNNSSSSTTTTTTTNLATTNQQRRQRPANTTNPPRLRHILRRPWSPEEEEALIEALKEFGPSWSKILEKYGAGGSKSEALKNRTQVQLKDKARNWKMGFLKNKGEVPEYLAKVTGDLGDDRSQKKRKRDTTTTNGNGNSKKPRSKSPNNEANKSKDKQQSQQSQPTSQPTSQPVPSQPVPSESITSQESRERVVQQESNVRTEKEQEQLEQSKEDEIPIEQEPSKQERSKPSDTTADTAAAQPTEPSKTTTTTATTTTTSE